MRITHDSTPPAADVAQFLSWPGGGEPREMEAAAFDPADLVALTSAQWPQWPALAEALRGCTMQWARDARYAFLLDPAVHDDRWRYKANVVVHCPVHGRLGIDVLECGAIGGLEYMDRENPLPGWAAPLDLEVATRPIRVVHRSWDPAAE